MVIMNPNFEYGPYGDHISANLILPFAPYIQLTHLLQDGPMKLQWSINAYSHNSWNSVWNYVPWSTKNSIGTPNLLNTLSKNAYVALSLLQSSNKTNSNHLETCSIITKTYQLCRCVKFNGPTKSKLHRYPSPIIGKGCRWGIGALKDTQTWSPTIHLKTNC
jgi:hypothetical protein